MTNAQTRKLNQKISRRLLKFPVDFQISRSVRHRDHHDEYEISHYKWRQC